MKTRPPEQLYGTDFYAWIQAQAKELRRLARLRPNLPLDLAYIAEEICDLGKSEKDAMFSLAQQILQHFLLIEHAPAVERRLHWADEIDHFRDRLQRKLSPTIRRRLSRELAGVFGSARRRVQRKMECDGAHHAAAALPDVCPYSLEQILGCRTGRQPARPEDANPAASSSPPIRHAYGWARGPGG
jgi:hypothetical protein